MRYCKDLGYCDGRGSSLCRSDVFFLSLALGDVDYTVACVLYVTLSVVWVWTEVRVDLALDDVT